MMSLQAIIFDIFIIKVIKHFPRKVVSSNENTNEIKLIKIDVDIALINIYFSSMIP